MTRDVERGIDIRKQIDLLEEELAGIEKKLKQAGIESPEQHEPLSDEEREGKQFMARGSEHVVPVVFTADLLVKSFQHLSPMHSKLRVALGSKPEMLARFFEQPKKWESKFESGKKFRKFADEVLGAAGPAFITACVARDKDGIAKSAIKVEWDRATEIAGRKAGV